MHVVGLAMQMVHRGGGVNRRFIGGFETDAEELGLAMVDPDTDICVIHEKSRSCWQRPRRRGAAHREA
jgi:hypothetical protein